MRLKGIRVGIPIEYNNTSMDAEIVDIWKRTALLFAEGGATVKEVTFVGSYSQFFSNLMSLFIWLLIHSLSIFFI